ncbi:MAG: hypothetical protein M0036_12495 [Desulfobacteraceae bacterium]|nr:hypothetical protein [Desulfobacteraceae bacterium]
MNRDETEGVVKQKGGRRPMAKTVLVIDDESDIRDYLVAVLED